MKYELERLEHKIGVGAQNMDGMPHGTLTGSATEEHAIRLADLDMQIKWIQTSLDMVPDDMQDGIMNNIMYGSRFPLNEYAQLVPSLRVWQKEKQKFIVRVAKNFGYIC